MGKGAGTSKLKYHRDKWKQGGETKQTQHQYKFTKLQEFKRKPRNSSRSQTFTKRNWNYQKDNSHCGTAYVCHVSDQGGGTLGLQTGSHQRGESWGRAAGMCWHGESTTKEGLGHFSLKDRITCLQTWKTIVKRPVRSCSPCPLWTWQWISTMDKKC